MEYKSLFSPSKYLPNTIKLYPEQNVLVPKGKKSQLITAIFKRKATNDQPKSESSTQS